MVDANSLIEGHCKFRDGRKWKSRWAVVTKLSPVADCLQLQVYRDEKERARNGHTKASLSLQDFLALESGFTLDKESHTLAIICQDLCVVLAFDNRERLIQWSVRIANNLGEGQHFLVQLASAPVKSKLTPGPVKLHVTDRKFCLTGGIPPRLLGAWEVPHLRRYGVVEGRIVFEGGSRCGKGEGVHVLVPDPPQLNLIIDAFDLSSKGQLVRGPSVRRFGTGITDSPRKSMTSRLSEMRNLMPAESTANISMNSNATATTTHITINSTVSPTPRESRSAEALCSACGELNPPTNGLWISSESSSRCDLDNMDTISVVAVTGSLATNCTELVTAESNLNGMNGSGSNVPLQSKAPPLSPSRNPQSQIAKPLPSAMERCLSCMSKLGQQGQDILSPSWTMDLNVSTTTTANSQVVNNSIGSGNSDRLSISSHGSSGGGGPPEYYYDTPRSVLGAEMRRAARAGTPPGVFTNNQMQASTNCHFSGGLQPQTASPYRVPRNGVANGCGGGSCGSQTHNINGSGMVSPQQQNHGPCGGSCHCQGRTMASGNGHIYYNSVAEQKSHRGGGKPPINLYPGGSPYENYDFPRCNSQAVSINSQQINCYPQQSYGETGSGGPGSNGGGSGPSSMSGIDWSKKPPMDRTSVATTATSLSSADQLSEFYDTPRQVCPCCVPTVSGCPCCISGQSSVQSHHLHQQNQVPHPQQQQNHSHYQNPSCIMRRDPMENYDIPPHNNPHNMLIASGPSSIHSAKDINSHSMQHSTTSISINGEGKMPLVAGSMPMNTRPNPHAIYAQVDKSKKTPRPLQPQNQQHFIACDSHNPIYENRNTAVQQQPTYMNLEGSSNGCGGSTGARAKPPAPDPTISHVGHEPSTHGPYGHSNYVNLEFAESLQLYENARKPSNAELPKETQVLVDIHHHNHHSDSNQDSNPKEALQSQLPETEPIPPVTLPVKNIETIQENEYENTGESSLQETVVPKPDTKAEIVGNKSEEIKESAALGKDDDKSESRSISVDISEKTESSGVDRRGSQESNSDEAASLPLRRSSSVPCKGGHANRGSASSSDSGVSGDGGLFFDDSSPLNDIGSLCLHESLPRKSQRGSPGASTGKNGSSTSTPKPQDSVERPSESPPTTVDPTLANRHYETIDEVESKIAQIAVSGGGESIGGVCPPKLSSSVILSHPVNPSVAAVKSADPASILQNRGKSLVSDANSTSSGNSDMSDYIESLSSCSRGGSSDTLMGTGIIPASNPGGVVTNVNLNISASPKKSAIMKPRSGKEYFKIDRSMFKSD